MPTATARRRQHFKEHKDTRQSIAVFEQFDLIAEPGTRFRYTSYGYNLLGAVIEGASGESYGGYMRRHVWGPLGMDTIVMDDPDAVIAHRVRGYRLAGKEWKNAEFVDISSRFSAGGTRASVPDMLAFGRGVHEGKILSAASVAAMVQPMATRAGRLTDYGMGWEVVPTGGRYAIAHSGQQPETVTYLYSFPSRKLTIAVAANLERVNPEAFVQRLFEVVTGEAVAAEHVYRRCGRAARVPGGARPVRGGQGVRRAHASTVCRCGRHARGIYADQPPGAGARRQGGARLHRSGPPSRRRKSVS